MGSSGSALPQQHSSHGAGGESDVQPNEWGWVEVCQECSVDELEYTEWLTVIWQSDLPWPPPAEAYLKSLMIKHQVFLPSHCKQGSANENQTAELMKAFLEVVTAHFKGWNASIHDQMIRQKIDIKIAEVREAMLLSKELLRTSSCFELAPTSLPANIRVRTSLSPAIRPPLPPTVPSNAPDTPPSTPQASQEQIQPQSFQSSQFLKELDSWKTLPIEAQMDFIAQLICAAEEHKTLVKQLSIFCAECQGEDFVRPQRKRKPPPKPKMTSQSTQTMEAAPIPSECSVPYSQSTQTVETTSRSLKYIGSRLQSRVNSPAYATTPQDEGQGNSAVQSTTSDDQTRPALPHHKQVTSDTEPPRPNASVTGIVSQAKNKPSVTKSGKTSAQQVATKAQQKTAGTTEKGPQVSDTAGPEEQNTITVDSSKYARLPPKAPAGIQHQMRDPVPTEPFHTESPVTRAPQALMLSAYVSGTTMSKEATSLPASTTSKAPVAPMQASQLTPLNNSNSSLRKQPWWTASFPQPTQPNPVVDQRRGFSGPSNDHLPGLTERPSTPQQPQPKPIGSITRPIEVPSEPMQQPPLSPRKSMEQQQQRSQPKAVNWSTSAPPKMSVKGLAEKLKRDQEKTGRALQKGDVQANKASAQDPALKRQLQSAIEGNGGAKRMRTV